MKRFAKVAVDKATFGYDRLYDYGIPQELIATVREGARVLVPFGSGNRRRQGVVLSLWEREELSGGPAESGVNHPGEPPEPEIALSKIKPILRVLDDPPLLGPEQLQLIHRLVNTTFCTYYDAVKLLIPTGVNFDILSCYQLNRQWEGDLDSLSPLERQAADLLKGKKKPVEGQKLCQTLGLETAALLDQMAQKGVLLRTEDAKRRVGDESVTMVRLTAEALEGDLLGGRFTEKQRQVIELLSTAGAAAIKEIGYYTSATRAVTDGLLRRGVVEYFENLVYRTPVKASGRRENPDRIVLTPEQQEAYDRLAASADGGKPSVTLLQGVTGSGKTSVYLKLLHHVVEQGRTAIVMVPEIGLTPQLITRFQTYFGDRVALLHSGLSMGERVDEWRRLREGRADIVVGTRSAVFAPLDNIGLIIMDEEQEGSYKSDSNPRYHAREVAKLRCVWHSCPLLLASATPTVESSYFARKGRYGLARLTQRYGDAVLPQVAVVDMREEETDGSPSSLSGVLREEIRANLEKGEQTILLINRRGYNTVVKCAQCGEVASCPNCSIALTYHKANGRLMCHYCGYSQALSDSCQKCGSKYIQYTGAGTQKLEDELNALFPAARILRMDLDTTMAKFSHQKYFSQFAAGEYDIMVGTQMVAKGLDFPNVTLVGVLSADATLFGNDFKCYEKTFSLLTQVVGRCGRADKPGRAYIQTFSPDNPVIGMAADQDYEAFYHSELINRKLMLYPPFCDLCCIGFSGEGEEETHNASTDFLRLLTGRAKADYPALPLRLIGPTPSGLYKLSNKYRFKLLIKCRNDRSFREMLSAVLKDFGLDRRYKKVSLSVDMYFDGAL